MDFECFDKLQSEIYIFASKLKSEKYWSESSVTDWALYSDSLDGTLARIVLAGYRSEPAKRPIGDINCHVDSNQSDTICRNSSNAFISSKRPVRALPASVFISASAIGSIPSKSSKLVAEVRRRGSVITCVTDAGANSWRAAENETSNETSLSTVCRIA